MMNAILTNVASESDASHCVPIRFHLASKTEINREVSTLNSVTSMKLKARGEDCTIGALFHDTKLR